LALSQAAKIAAAKIRYRRSFRGGKAVRIEIIRLAKGLDQANCLTDQTPS
jgi:hypothetical protein